MRISQRTARCRGPFDLSLIDAEFEASGADLRDLFYLVGVSLPNTGTFHLQGRMVRRGSETLFEISRLYRAKAICRGGYRLTRKKAAAPLCTPI